MILWAAVAMAWTEWTGTVEVTAPDGWDPGALTAVDAHPSWEGTQITVHASQGEGVFALWAEGVDADGRPGRIRLVSGVGTMRSVWVGCGQVLVDTADGAVVLRHVLDPEDGLDRLSEWDLTDAADGDADGVSDATEATYTCSDPDDPDSDDDGLDDFTDWNLGCSTRLADSDGGGVDDRDEWYRHRTSCAVTADDDPGLGAGDPDGDGLTSDEEVDVHGTDAFTADTDGDGLEDGEEAGFGTDPLLLDTDGGGTQDGEALLGEDPLDPADDVGLIVRWECGALDASDLVGCDVTLPIEDGVDAETLADALAAQAACDELRARYEMDTDGDGVTDYQEALSCGSDPTVPDTDGDGLTDGEELTGDWERSDPARSDTDGDGLSDLVERRTGTSAVEPDTDRDGLEDPAELDAGTSPRRADSDGGGATDDEALVGGDPLDPADDGDLRRDSDGDALSDLDELLRGCDPYDPDTDDDGLGDRAEELPADCSDPDTDGDGWLDGEEAFAGTQPWNVLSHP